MLRRLLSLQACCLVTALAQPIDARDSLVHPVNPPIPVPSKNLNNSQILPMATPGPGQAILKIEKAELDESNPAAKELKVEISHLSKEALDASAVRVMCYFYETGADGRLELTKSKVSPEWKTPPVDWKESATEALVIRYPNPAPSPGTKYAGYSVGIYYKDELQASTASSQEVEKNFPLPASGAVPASKLDESEAFLLAYSLLQDAEKSYERDDLDGARKSVRRAIAAFTKLQKDSPSWQPRLVDYRIATAKMLESKIDGK